MPASQSLRDEIAELRRKVGELEGRLEAAQAILVDRRRMEQELRDAVAAKDTLIRETNHRVKNHLQIMASLVQMEALRRSEDAQDLADSILRRISVIAALHDSLYKADRGTAVDGAAYLGSICENLSSEELPVIARAAPDLQLATDQAMPLAMIVNEAVCNAIKYAYPDRRGAIHVTLDVASGREMIECAVVDRGVGLSGEVPGRKGLGTMLMAALGRQLGGTFQLTSPDDGGTTAVLRFPRTI